MSASGRAPPRPDRAGSEISTADLLENKEVQERNVGRNRRAKGFGTAAPLTAEGGGGVQSLYRATFD